jgi:hypothetical protein
MLCLSLPVAMELQIPDLPPLWVRLHQHHNLLPYLIALSAGYGRAQTSESEVTNEEGVVQVP